MQMNKRNSVKISVLYGKRTQQSGKLCHSKKMKQSALVRLVFKKVLSAMMSRTFAIENKGNLSFGRLFVEKRTKKTLI